jgi:hypothetical protein
VYRNWANWILKGAGIDVVISDFCIDLADGTILNRMVEAFSGRQQRYTKVCANEFQKIDNINLALAWFKRKGLITTVASQDFVSGNIRPILGFFWMLIQKYQLVSNQSMSFMPEEDTGSIYDWVANYVKGATVGVALLRSSNCLHSASFASPLALLTALRTTPEWGT